MSRIGGDQYPEFVTPEDPVNIKIKRCPVGRQDAHPRILIMRLAAFGDVLMATPLVSALRVAYPNAHITWVVERNQSDTILANPDIDEVLLWQGRYWKRLIRRGLLPMWALQGLLLQRELRRRHYDIFISLQPEEWPLFATATNAPVRIGIFDTFRRFNRATDTSKYVKRYTSAYTLEHLPEHRTRQYLLALRTLGLSDDVSLQMSCGFTESDLRIADEFLANHGAVANSSLIVIAPQTTWPSRCWPEDHFLKLANRLADAGNRIVLIGSPKEREGINRLAAGLNTRPIVADGNLTFRQTTAIISRARLVVSGDTGPMHTAAAIGTPYVALFGSTSPSWYGPFSGHGVSLSHKVPCGPCDQKLCSQAGDGYLKCLRLVTVDEVYENSMRLLTRKSNSA